MTAKLRSQGHNEPSWYHFSAALREETLQCCKPRFSEDASCRFLKGRGMQGVHLVLRTPKFARTRGRSFDLVDEHNAVIEAQGRVLVCKFGLPLSDRIVSTINDEIDARRSPSLIIVTKQKKVFTGLSSPIVGFVRAPFKDDVKALLPAYYDPEDLGTHPTGRNPIGVLVSKKFEYANLAPLSLISNGRTLLDVIQECRTATMLVTA